MKVLAISASPRKCGNAEVLCDEFLKGAAESGHDVQKIRLAEKKIAPCSCLLRLRRQPRLRPPRRYGRGAGSAQGR